MAHENGLITKPVNTTDVCSTIGEGKHRIGYLCISENINIYSKNKPMRHSTLAELNDTNKKAAKYGYRIPAAVEGTTIMNYFTSSTTPSAWSPSSSDAPYVIITNGWWYERPKGGTSSPYRLGDFNGYNHKTNNSEYFCKVSQKDMLISDGISYGFDVDIVDFTIDPNVGELFGSGEYVLCVAAVKIVSGNADLNTVKIKTGPYYLSGTKHDWIVHFYDDEMETIFGTSNSTWDLCFMAVPINSATVTDPDSPNVGHIKPYQNYDNSQAAAIETTHLPRFTLNCIPLPTDKIRVSYTKASVVVVNPYEGLNFTIVSGNIAVNAAGRVTVTMTNLTIQNTTSASKGVSSTLLGFIISAYGNSTGTLRESDFIPFAESGSTTINANSTANLWGSSTSRTVATDAMTFVPQTGDDDTSFSGYSASLCVRVSNGDVTRIFPLGAYIYRD